jgi:hypothetical protein
MFITALVSGVIAFSPLSPSGAQPQALDTGVPVDPASLILMQSATFDSNGVANESDLDSYFRVSLAANIAVDADIDGIRDVELGVRDADIEFDPGVDFRFAIGIPIVDWFSIEIGSGFAWNNVKAVTGDWLDINNTVIAEITGGSGYLLQVPIMLDLVVDFDLTKTFNLSLSAGCGVQFSAVDIDDVGASTVAGASARLQDTVAAFRYEFAIAGTWSMNSDVDFGIFARYSGTTSSNLGKATFDNPPAGLVPTESITVQDFQNIAVGLMMRIDF